MVAERVMKPEVSERELVADFAETAQVHGFKVVQHSVSHNHERDETTLAVRFVKASGAEKQSVLKMAKDDGSE